MRLAPTYLLTALLFMPTGANADFSTELVDGCIEPLIRGEELGEYFDPGTLKMTPASGNETGRQWRIGSTYWLSESRSASGLRGCRISREGAGNLDAVATGTREVADYLWTGFAEVAEALLRSGDFVVRDVQAVADMRLRAIESVRRNPSGRVVAAFVAHDLQSDYAFIFVGEDDGGRK